MTKGFVGGLIILGMPTFLDVPTGRPEFVVGIQGINFKTTLHGN